MAAVGPPNNVAAALTAMEQHTGRVNVAEFARLFNIPRSTLADAWAKLRDFQSTRTGEEENYAINLVYHRIDGRGRNTNRSLTDAEEENVIEQLKENYPHGFATRIFVASVILSNTNCDLNQINWVNTSLHVSSIAMESLAQSFSPVLVRWRYRH